MGAEPRLNVPFEFEKRCCASAACTVRDIEIQRATGMQMQTFLHSHFAHRSKGGPGGGGSFLIKGRYTC